MKKDVVVSRAAYESLADDLEWWQVKARKLGYYALRLRELLAAVTGELGRAVSKTSSLCWYCSLCGAVEPVQEEGYELGDSEPCVDCDGVACVVTRAEVESRSWRCFHCQELLTSEKSAREHFGATQGSVPACQVDIEHLRDLERQVESYRNEESELAAHFQQRDADRAVLIRRAEEEGARHV